MFVFRVYIVAIPIDNIILIFLCEFVQGVHLVFDDFFAGAGLEVIGPSGCKILTHLIRSVEVPMMNRKRPCIHIIAGENAEGSQNQDSVNATDENGTLAQFDMPERLGWIVRKSKAFLEAEGLQTTATPVNGILCDQVDERAHY